MRRRTILLAGLGAGAAASAGLLGWRGLQTGDSPAQGDFLEPSVRVPGADGWKAEVSAGNMPVLDAEHGQLVLYDYDGVVYALDTATGATRWRTPSDGKMSGDLHLIGPSVVIEGTDAVYAFDRVSGQQLWRFPTVRPAAVAPLAAGGPLAIATTRGVLTSLDPATGQAVWRVDPAHEAGDFGNLQTVVIGGTVAAVFPSVIGGGFSTRMIAVDAGSGASRWTMDAQVRYGYRWIGPCAPAGLVLAIHARTVGSFDDDPNTLRSELTAFDPHTGQRVWGFSAYQIADGPLVSGDIVYVQSEPSFGAPSQLHALDTRTGQAKWTRELTTEAAFAADSGVVCAAGAGGVAAFDATTGAARWAHPVQDVAFSSPHIHAGILYLPGLMQAQGGVYRWRIENGEELPRLWPQVLGAWFVLAGGAMYLTSERFVQAMPIDPAA